MTALPRGSTIGILGGGQLGQMLALAAAPLGYRTVVFTPRPGPASQVTDRTVLAPYDDEDALDRFASMVEVVTCEFENVPAAAAQRLEGVVPVRPGPRALATCRDRLLERRFLEGAGVPVAPWGVAGSAAEAAAEVARIGGPCVLKTTQLGYDGKGQARLSPGEDPDRVWAAVSAHAPEAPVLVEGFVDFDCEVSALAARGLDGEVVTWDVGRNVHRDHILHETHVPSGLSPEREAEARRIATHLITALEIVGPLAVEMFHTRSGDLVVNELAARPHNSGHWTQDGALTCQFAQAIRAVAGLPLGSTARRGRVRMDNLLGDEVDAAHRHVADPHASLHLYGKAEVRPGRKMGHVNRVWI